MSWSYAIDNQEKLAEEVEEELAGSTLNLLFRKKGGLSVYRTVKDYRNCVIPIIRRPP